MAMYEAAITKLNVVIDIGEAYTKVGFSGDYSPQAIFPTEVQCRSTGTVRKIHDYKDERDLYDLLVDFVRAVYFEYALTSPKERAVTVVESPLCPTAFRETLARVLFRHYEVASVLFLPAHLVCLAPLYIDTGLVLDVGYAEAVAVPVCHGSPLIHAWQALDLGAKAVHSKLKTLLSADNMGIQNIEESVLEDIKVKCCFVTTPDRAEKLLLSSKEALLEPCPDVEYPLGGSKTLKISGKIRETAFEPLFDEDNDHQCISTMLLDALKRVDVDSRRKLAENVVLIGGTAATPGFKARLRDELYKQLKRDRYADLKIEKFMFHTLPAKDNYAAWLGGAIYAATDYYEMNCVTREWYFAENRIPDWVNLKDCLKSI